MKVNSTRHRALRALIISSLAASPLLGCGGGEGDDATGGAPAEAGSPAAGASAEGGSAEGGAEGGAERNDEPSEGGETGAVSGGEGAGEGGEAAGATPEAGEAAGAPGGAEGGEVVIDVAGVEEEMYDPIDESVPGEGIHAFTMTDINGEEVDMRRYRNRVVLVVNVASRCGYTRQYDDLQALYETYKDRGLVVLGFPANNFGGQEPGSDEEISEFCTTNFGITFPMFSKISVKGDDMHPLYGYLTGESGQDVGWNFNKFLVGTDGLYVGHYQSGTEPLSAELTSAIEALLPSP